MAAQRDFGLRLPAPRSSVWWQRLGRLGGGWSAVTGGSNNFAAEFWSAISGGTSNNAGGALVFIGGGETNAASGSMSVIGGGSGNRALEQFSVAGGGSQNVVGGFSSTVGFATVPGGAGNVAGGQSSFKAGRNARALRSGAFFWADNSTAAAFGSTACRNRTRRLRNASPCWSARSPGWCLNRDWITNEAHHAAISRMAE